MTTPNSSCNVQLKDGFPLASDSSSKDSLKGDRTSWDKSQAHKNDGEPAEAAVPDAVLPISAMINLKREEETNGKDVQIVNEGTYK